MSASATTQISKLQKMNLQELRDEYERAFGKSTKSRNRKQLFSQIARKLQADRRGQTLDVTSGKPTLTVKYQPKKKAVIKAKAKTKKVASKKAKAKTTCSTSKKSKQATPVGQRDPRLPKVGTIITKEYKGQTINVRVLEKGFEYDGDVFRSLSAVAKHVTGSIWNGYLFFGMVKRGSKIA